MLFLVEYNPESGRVLMLEQFPHENEAQANAKRLELELKANKKGLRREIVILEAKDKAALRKTHGRYFSRVDRKPLAA